MNSDLTARITAFLDAHHVMSLATVGGDGPHAANLFYARDGYALIWVSDTVELWGIVDSASEKKAVCIAAEVTPGVRAVNDNLIVRPAQWRY